MTSGSLVSFDNKIAPSTDATKNLAICSGLHVVTISHRAWAFRSSTVTRPMRPSATLANPSARSLFCRNLRFFCFGAVGTLISSLLYGASRERSVEVSVKSF
jgi:hypothetical protein